MGEMEHNAHRLRVALAILHNNLRGQGFDMLKPISVEFANEMADFALDALQGAPNERLDEAVRNDTQWK